MPAASHHLSIDVSHLSWIAHTILQHFYKKSSPWFRPKQATCQPTQYVPWVTHTVVASKNQSMGIFIGNSGTDKKN